MAETAAYPGTPRWAKIFGIISSVVVLLFVILLLTRGHGPARHGSVDGPASPNATEEHTPRDHP